MSLDPVQDFLFAFPEVLFAISILLHEIIEAHAKAKRDFLVGSSGHATHIVSSVNPRFSATAVVSIDEPNLVPKSF
jgi:hypothetical protein